MILSPVQIKTDEGNTISGALIEREDLMNLISMINRTNADGLKGADALVMMQLQDAAKDLSHLDPEKK